MPDDPKYAHSLPPGLGPWHELGRHLSETADRARAFAEPWGGDTFAYLAGLWHDLGKYAPSWQAFLREVGQEAHVCDSEIPVLLGRRRGGDHSSAGAVHAESLGAAALPIQFATAGHHAGLADRQDLRSRLADKRDLYEAALAEADPAIVAIGQHPVYPAFLNQPAPTGARHRALETFVRMIFSALVDADFLDTEAFYESVKPESDRRFRAQWAPLSEYSQLLDAHLDTLQSTAPDTVVNSWRRQVLAWCRAAAKWPPGSFSLTVPTGGGKTLASLAFALDHALAHGLDRIVVALPFTAILDQTASVFREVFRALGEDVLVEHHSAIDPVRERALNRLASENWDAPLVVTTQVQLLESLFASRTSRCRKLHNLARSVLILDEVQTLPVGLLAPILDQLQELASNYGTTVVLTTATQPALHSRRLGPRIFAGFEPQPREIVPERSLSDLFGALRRIRVHWPERDVTGWEDLARDVLAHPRALVIVHRRADAADLWRALRAAGDTEAMHLSALMCAAHRREVLPAIRRRLADGAVCRVVSTQVVEAGVDLDFPVVYRAMAGLESLAQAAGRCNREGLLPAGDFHVFRPPTQPPVLLRNHKEIAEIMLAGNPALDPIAPATFHAYFDRLYAVRSTDERQIQPLRESLCFERTSDRFRMIDDATETIVVPFGAAGRDALDRFRALGPSRPTLRALQPFTVSVYPSTLASLLASGAIRLVHDTVHALLSTDLYDPILGLRMQATEDGPLIV